MKWIITFMLLLLMQHEGFCQKQFEGKIVYEFFGEGKSEKDSTEILFGKNALRFNFKNKNTPDRNDMHVIILLDAGKIYSINDTGKTYTESKLEETPKIKIPNINSKKVAGYGTTAIINSDHFFGARNYFGKNVQYVHFIADSLFYTIPEKFRLNDEFIFFQDNKIVLEMQFNKSLGASNHKIQSPDSINLALSFRACSVQSMKLSPKLFSIPEGYRLDNKGNDGDFESPSSDSAPKSKPASTKSPARKPE